MQRTLNSSAATSRKSAAEAVLFAIHIYAARPAADTGKVLQEETGHKNGLPTCEPFKCQSLRQQTTMLSRFRLSNGNRWVRIKTSETERRPARGEGEWVTKRDGTKGDKSRLHLSDHGGPKKSKTMWILPFDLICF